MQTPENLIDAVLEDSGLTLQQLATLCAVEPEWIAWHVEDGLLDPLPLPQRQTEWRFSSAHLVRVRRIVSLERNFEAVPELAALVADMQEEIDDLRRRLRRAGLE